MVRMMEELKHFPVSKLKPQTTSFSGSLHFNPYCKLSPVVWYEIKIDLEPFDLGEDVPDDPYTEYFGTEVETTLIAGGIILPFRDWRQISGEYGPVENVGQGHIYVSGVHNTVDTERIRFERIQGARFRILIDLAIAFEYESAGFYDTKCSLEFETEFTGLSFDAPVWSSPDTVKFPQDWRIPKSFDGTTVTELFERFVDTNLYDLTQVGQSFNLLPKV